MPQTVLHYDGKVRLRFDDAGEKYIYMDILKRAKGLKSINTRSPMSRTLLVEYQDNSEAHELVNKIISSIEPEQLSGNDVFSYISPLLKNPLTKVMWLMLIYGSKPGFLQFCISSMMVNKYLRAKFK